jgi:hypothetical protein
MFQTVHTYSAYHAAARSLSGGPICITDEPGTHDLGLLEQMIARKGTKTLICRTSGIGRAVDVYSGHLEGKFCKLGVTHDIAVSHGDQFTENQDEGADEEEAREDMKVETMTTRILGIFNMSPASRTEFIPLTDFALVAPDSNFSIQGKQLFLLHSHNTNTLSRPLALYHSPGRRIPLIPVTLPERGFEILTLHPIILAKPPAVMEATSAAGATESAKAGAAVLGMVCPALPGDSTAPAMKRPKFAGCAVATSVNLSVTTELAYGLHISVRLKALSDTLAIFVQLAPPSQPGTQTGRGIISARAAIVLVISHEGRDKRKEHRFDVRAEVCQVDQHAEHDNGEGVEHLALVKIGLESSLEAQLALKAATAGPTSKEVGITVDVEIALSEF